MIQTGRRSQRVFVAKGKQMQSGGQPRQTPSARMEKEPHLKDYLSMVAARKWVVISAFLVCVGMTAIYVFVQTPVYRASCRLEIQPASSDATEIKAAYDPTLSEVGGDSIRQAFLQTQFEMILADPVITKTFRTFGFRETPAYKGSKDPESAFKKRFAVSPIRDTWLADVTFEWTDPEQAAAVLDYLVKTYLEEYRNRSQGMDRETLSAKKSKVAELGPQVVEKYRVLQTFIAENGLVSLDGAAEKVSKRYDDLTEALNAATLKYSEAKSRYKDIFSAIKENRLEEMPEIFENSNIDALKLELIKAELHLNELKQLVIIDLIDLKTAGQPLLGEIISKGQRILGSDTRYAQLITKNLFDRADFLPYRNRILKERRESWIGK